MKIICSSNNNGEPIENALKYVCGTHYRTLGSRLSGWSAHSLRPLKKYGRFNCTAGGCNKKKNETLTNTHRFTCAPGGPIGPSTPLSPAGP